jgi:hypothetical protein
MDEGHSETELYAAFKIRAEMHEDGEICAQKIAHLRPCIGKRGVAKSTHRS